MGSCNPINESKNLFLEIKENAAKYISRELDLNPVFDKTDLLFNKITEGQIVANKVYQDSALLKIQSKITKEAARSYQIDALVFDPISFCEKVKIKLGGNQNARNGNDGPSTSKQNAEAKVWKKLGEYSKTTMNSVPTFSFIYGTFDADPVEHVKKVRKQVAKDKVGDLTKPLAVNPGAALDESDVMLKDAHRVYTIFTKLVEKSKTNAICFYEFVTDPGSFTHTVENIFLLSLLVKEGHLCIFPDEQGLPYIRRVTKSEKNNSWDKASCMQSVLTITWEDWENIVKTFKFKTPLIPPRTSPVTNV